MGHQFHCHVRLPVPGIPYFFWDEHPYFLDFTSYFGVNIRVHKGCRILFCRGLREVFLLLQKKKTCYDIVLIFDMIKVFNSPETVISPEIISFSFLCQALQNILGIARRSCTYLGWSCRLSCSLHEKTRHHRLMVRGTSCTLATSAFWRQRSSTCNARRAATLFYFRAHFNILATTYSSIRIWSKLHIYSSCSFCSSLPSARKPKLEALMFSWGCIQIIHCNLAKRAADCPNMSLNILRSSMIFPAFFRDCFMGVYNPPRGMVFYVFLSLIFLYPLVNKPSYGKIHHAINGKIMEIPLFLWPCSIAFCMFTRG